MHWKTALSWLGIALTFLAFAPYIRRILSGGVTPHAMSWAIWAGSTIAVFVAQLSSGAGTGAWPIGVSAVVTASIAMLAYRKGGQWAAHPSDWVFLLVASSALPVWFATSEPLWAVLILTMVDLAGFGPTLRKAYIEPWSESLMFFLVMALRNGLVVAALERYNAATILFPAVIGLACLATVGVLASRRVAARRSSA